MPILPMVLVNGAEGIGTGWSTSIPNYNPRDIVANLQRLLDGQPLVPMQPWYKGFRGTIHEIDSKTAGKSYAINGCVAQVGYEPSTLGLPLSPRGATDLLQSTTPHLKQSSTLV